nr:methyl-accepting chemotaxis protein [Pseudovibrio flavus]
MDAAAELVGLTDSTSARVLFSELILALDLMGDNLKPVVDYFQKDGISSQERAQLVGDNSSLYTTKHEMIHSDFFSAWQDDNYADLLIIDEFGRIVYTVTKGPEFLKNISDPVVADTALFDVFESVKTVPNGEYIATPVGSYAPADNENTMFVASPVFIENVGEEVFRGAIVLRLNPSFVDGVLKVRSPAGDSYQSYLVDRSGALASTQLLDPDLPLGTIVAPFVVGNTELDTGYAHTSNSDMMTAATSVDLFGEKMVMVSELAIEEAMKPVYALRESILWTSLPVLLVVVIIALFISRAISLPLTRLGRAIAEIAGGDLDAKLPKTREGSEIGAIAVSIEGFRGALRREKEMQRQQESDQREKDERSKLLEAINRQFDSEVRESLAPVATAVQALRQNAEHMASISRQTNEEAQTVSVASEQSLMNLRAVASATEELSATVGDIDQRVRHSAEIAVEATRMASNAETSVSGLMEAARKIGEILSLISDIADQTNLLALNATIEAARAGEAGRGFAVVAAEVKGLANQTGSATSEISAQVLAVQAETEKAVAAIREIAGVISKMNDVSNAVASAVQEQAVTTNEISENIQQVSTGSSEVSSAIVRVSDIAGTAGQEANGVLIAADQLGEQADAISRLVEDFLGKVRAA